MKCNLSSSELEAIRLVITTMTVQLTWKKEIDLTLIKLWTITCMAFMHFISLLQAVLIRATLEPVNLLPVYMCLFIPSLNVVINPLVHILFRPSMLKKLLGLYKWLWYWLHSCDKHYHPTKLASEEDQHAHITCVRMFSKVLKFSVLVTNSSTRFYIE